MKKTIKIKGWQNNNDSIALAVCTFIGSLFYEPQIRFSIPAEGIYLIVISNYLEKILIRFRPPGYNIPDLMPLIINNKRQWPLIPFIT
jgi:hypothetical protein